MNTHTYGAWTGTGLKLQFGRVWGNWRICNTEASFLPNRGQIPSTWDCRKAVDVQKTDSHVTNSKYVAPQRHFRYGSALDAFKTSQRWPRLITIVVNDPCPLQWRRFDCRASSVRNGVRWRDCTAHMPCDAYGSNVDTGANTAQILAAPPATKFRGKSVCFARTTLAPQHRT
ncbi:hypothetical protein BJV77DRAFT_963188 [Russula vinacea]|nr:hypothetical protein BJV77DRAFT_963188 [Russula vinacea]